MMTTSRSKLDQARTAESLRVLREFFRATIDAAQERGLQGDAIATLGINLTIKGYAELLERSDACPSPTCSCKQAVTTAHDWLLMCAQMFTDAATATTHQELRERCRIHLFEPGDSTLGPPN